MFPLFFRQRNPITKETRCPSRSPDPCGAVRRQVGAGDGRAGSGTWVAWAGRLLLMGLYSGLKCFVPKPSLIEGCFSCPNEMWALTQSVCWTTTTTTTTTSHLWAGWTQSTACCMKELCHGIMRRNNSIIGDLFNRPSATVWQ